MDDFLTPHARRAVALLNDRVSTAAELRSKLKLNGVKFKETLNLLVDKGLIQPRRGIRDEGLRLTPKGEEVAASLAILVILTDEL